MSRNKTNIRSFEDLKKERIRLRSEVVDIEKDFKNNSVLKIGSAIFGKDPHHDSVFKKPLSFIPRSNKLSINNNRLISATEGLLGTFLISNKLTRKYFIGYTIAKEMIPYALEKFGEIFNKKR